MGSPTTTTDSPTLLVVFARSPVPGHTKTRLIPLLGEVGAARLAEAFLDDTLARTRSVSDRRVLALASRIEQADQVDQAERFEHPDISRLAAREKITVVAQGRGDLGARMREAIVSGLAAGAGRVIVVGSDAPLLSPRAIAEAFTLLCKTDVVLGPTDDGGYWLIGARRDLPQLFESMPWSTSSVFGESVRRLQSLSASFALAEPFWDVDEPADLERLCNALTLDRGIAPATRAALLALKMFPADRTKE